MRVGDRVGCRGGLCRGRRGTVVEVHAYDDSAGVRRVLVRWDNGVHCLLAEHELRKVGKRHGV